MKQKSLIRPVVSLCLAALTWLAFTPALIAHPYATCLTNSAGIVSFRVNESNATCKVIGNLGTLTNDLGVLNYPQFGTNGLVVTNLTASGMTGGVFSVVLQKAGSGAPSLISENLNTNNMFFSPRGVAVNKRPASPYFGRIYVGSALPGTTGSGRPCGDGIYVMNADSTDALGQGNTALTAGLNMVTGSASMPWRVRVGQDDDMIYICDFTDTTGNLWRTDPDVSATSGTNMFALFTGPYVGTGTGLPAGYNHGSLSEVYVTGTLAGGNLTVYTADEDYETNPGFLTELNSLWRYDIGDAGAGASFPWSNAPNAKLATPTIGFIGQTMGLDRATNGYFYLLDQRSAGASKCLQVINPAGPTEVYESFTDSTVNIGFPRDILSNSVSVAVSRDMNYMAVLRAAGQVVVVPLVNGIPNLAGRIEFVGAGTSRAIDFDAADNIYLVSNATERMRVYSLGLTTTATTTSDGTFSLITPTTTVGVTKDTDTVYEAGPTTAVLTFTRAGEPLVNPLTVAFTTAGAVRGTDYVLQTNSVTFTGNSVIIPAGVDNVTVSLIAQNDAVAELTETVTVNVAGTTFYSAGTPASQTVAIVDNEPATADLEVVQGSMYERLTNDYVRLRVVRRGDTNAASFNVNLMYTGTAAPARYMAPATVTVDPGVVNQNFDVSPLNDSLLQGNQTIIANVQPGSGYNVGTNSPTATATIVDDEVLPETTLLYSENFNSLANSNNWTVRFGSGNGVDDYRYAFSADYASGVNPVTALTFPVLPPAPHSTSDTLGAYLSVNKDEGTALGAAGINLYPNGQSFSGNYAVRFDMYIMVGNAASTTEYALFGINHSGNNTNWFRNSAGGVPAGWTFDGLFYGIEADGAALGDYVIYSAPTTAGNNPTALTPGVNASALAGIFKEPPYGPTLLSGPGAPGCDETSATPSWSDVSIDKVGSLVRLKINNTPIMTITNTTAFTTGNIMLGYCDAFDSVMAGNSCIIYDNLRVVRLDDLKITKIEIVGANAEVTFTWGIDDPPTAFKLQSSTTVNTGYADTSATIIKLSPGVYKATIAQSGAARFYRVRYAP